MLTSWARALSVCAMLAAAAACSKSPAAPSEPTSLPATVTMSPGDTRSFSDAGVTLTMVDSPQPQCGPANQCLPWPSVIIQTDGPAGRVPIVLATNVEGMRVGHGNGVIITLLTLVEGSGTPRWTARMRVEQEPRLPFD